MKLIIKIFKIIIDIVSIAVLSIFIFTNLICSKILNENYILKELENTGYYDKIKEEVESDFENYVAQSGLDEDVMKNIISDKKIKNDTETIIKNIYKGTNTQLDTTEIEENLKKNIQESLKNTKINATGQKAIDEYINKIALQYKETMCHTKYEDTINKTLTKVKKYAEMAKKISLGTLIILIIIIIITNIKKIQNTLSQMGIILTSSGILYFILDIMLQSNIKIANIFIFNNAISDVIKDIFIDILTNIKNNGILLILIGIICIMIANIASINKKETKKNKIKKVGKHQK